MTDAGMPPPPTGLVFPCDYALKLMGRNTAEFRDAIRAIVARQPPHALAVDAERVSRDSTFLSLTCHVHVATREELDALYRELHATGLVLYAL